LGVGYGKQSGHGVQDVGIRAFALGIFALALSINLKHCKIIVKILFIN